MNIKTSGESFQMRYCVTFYFKGYQIIRIQIQHFEKRLLLLSKMESLNLQVLIAYMPLEIQRNTVHHLKALTSGTGYGSGHRNDNNLK